MLSLSRSLLLGLFLTSMPGCLIASGALFLHFCGDGVIDRGDGEDCDDANNIDDDACDNECKLFVVPPNEGCDDEILSPGDFCFDNPTQVDIGATAEGQLILGDFGGSNLLDAAFASNGNIVFIENVTATGDFDGTTRPVDANDVTINAFDAVDFDKDGKLDLLTGDNDAVGLLQQQNGAFQFAFTEIIFIANSGNNGEPTSAIGLSANIGDGGLDFAGTTKVVNGDAQLFIFQSPNLTESADFPNGDLLSIVEGDFGIAAISALPSNNLLFIGLDIVALEDDVFTTATIGTNPRDLFAVDLNDDNRDDLISANDDGVTILLQSGNNFVSGGEVDIPNASALDIGDLDDDGILDAVVAAGNKVFVLQGANDSFIDINVEINVGAKVLDVKIADMNDDGVNDIVVLTAGGLHVFQPNF